MGYNFDSRVEFNAFRHWFLWTHPKHPKLQHSVTGETGLRLHVTDWSHVTDLSLALRVFTISLRALADTWAHCIQAWPWEYSLSPWEFQGLIELIVLIHHSYDFFSNLVAITSNLVTIVSFFKQATSNLFILTCITLLRFFNSNWLTSALLLICTWSEHQPSQ